MKRILSLALALLLIATILPLGAIQASAATVTSRNDGVWLFPLASSYYNSFTDWAGCFGQDYTCPICKTHHSAGNCTAHSGQNGHNGIDIGVPKNTTVLAASDGTIVAAESMGSRGKTVVVEHKIQGTSYSYYSYYQHLESFKLTGGSVSAGTAIALSGNSGGNYGYHLHFGIVRGSSGLGKSALGTLEAKGWLLGSGNEGRILNNPALDSPAGFPTGKEAVDVQSMKNHPGSVRYTFNASEATKWSTPITYANITNDTYLLRNKSTSTYLNADGTASKSNVSVASSSSNNRQKFVVSGSDKKYALKTSFDSSLWINPASDNPSNGTNINIYPGSGELRSDMHWQFEAVSGGYIIHNATYTGLVLGLDGTNVRLETNTGASDQIWELVSLTHTHAYTQYVYYWAAHPHYKCYACSCGDVKENKNETSFTWSAWKQTKAPTCTATGVETRTCSLCDETETRTVAALGHSYGGWANAGSNHSRTCSRCNNVETASHTYGAWSQTKAATCTAAGSEARTCSVCSAKETREIKALGHSYSAATVTKAATCTETGVKTAKCSRCSQTVTESIPATGHSFGDWTQSKAPTCTEGGIETRTCSKCKLAEFRDVKALGHDFENPNVVREATIYQTGLIEGKCRRCKEATQQIIPCTATDAKTGTAFEAAEGVFATGTTLSVEEIGADDARRETIERAVAGSLKSFLAYELSAQADGVTVKPDGSFTVSFRLPSQYGEDTALYYVGEGGATTEVAATSYRDGTLTAEVNALGTYVIGEAATPTEETTEAPEVDAANDDLAGTEQDGVNPWVLLAVAGVLLAAAGVVIVLLLKKRK